MGKCQVLYVLLLFVAKRICFVSGHCPSPRWMEVEEAGKCYRYIRRSWSYDEAKSICQNLQGRLSSIDDLSNKSAIIRDVFRVKTFKVWADSDRMTIVYNSSQPEEKHVAKRICRVVDHSGANRTHGHMNCRRKFPFVCEYNYEKGISIKAIVAINIAALIFMAFILVICGSWINRYRKNEAYTVRHDSTAPLVTGKLDMEEMTCDSSPTHVVRETSGLDDSSENKKNKRVHFQSEKSFLDSQNDKSENIEIT